MGLFENWPYNNLHNLNLDWIIASMKQLQSEWSDFEIMHNIKFADPIEWSQAKPYDMYTIVLGPDGNSYLSKMGVPVGALLTNDLYWAKILDTNAQMAQEVTARENADATLAADLAAETNTRQAADTTQAGSIAAETSAREAADNALSGSIAAETSARQAADNVLSGSIAAETAAREARDNQLGTAANKNFDSDVTAGSSNLITSGAVYNVTAFKRTKKVVVIGDSYVHSDNGRTAIDQTLGAVAPNWDIRFSSDSGAAFTFGGAQGYTFDNLLNNAKTMFSDPSKVDYVILIGGRNEAGSQNSEHRPASGLASAANTFYTDAHSYFTNAKIITFMPYDWKLPNSNVNEVSLILKRESLKLNCAYADYCWSWGVGRESDMYIGGSDIHPNGAGSTYMSQLLYSAVENNDFDCFVGRYDTYDETNFILHREGITIAGKESTSGSSNLLIDIANFPTWLKYFGGIVWNFPAYNLTTDDGNGISVSISQYGLAVAGSTVISASRISYSFLAPLNMGL